MGHVETLGNKDVIEKKDILEGIKGELNAIEQHILFQDLIDEYEKIDNRRRAQTEVIYNMLRNSVDTNSFVGDEYQYYFWNKEYFQALWEFNDILSNEISFYLQNKDYKGESPFKRLLEQKSNLSEAYSRELDKYRAKFKGKNQLKPGFKKCVDAITKGVEITKEQIRKGNELVRKLRKL